MVTPGKIARRFKTIKNKFLKIYSLIKSNSMRKVLFALFIPVQYEDQQLNPIYTQGKRRVPGTGCYGEINEPGIMHQWGIRSHELNEGYLTDTMAVVEDRGGNVLLVPPELVKFAEPNAMAWDGRPHLVYENFEKVRIAGSDQVVFFADGFDMCIVSVAVCMFNDNRTIEDINAAIVNLGTYHMDEREIIITELEKLVKI